MLNPRTRPLALRAKRYLTLSSHEYPRVFGAWIPRSVV
jgi:hypothetical protein